MFGSLNISQGGNAPQNPLASLAKFLSAPGMNTSQPQMPQMQQPQQQMPANQTLNQGIMQQLGAPISNNPTLNMVSTPNQFAMPMRNM